MTSEGSLTSAVEVGIREIMRSLGSRRSNFPSEQVRHLPGGQGFSLIEMLVAVAVFALLLTLLAGAYSGFQKLTEQLRGAREANRTGRVAMAWIARDLERMRPRIPGDIWNVTAGTNTAKPTVDRGPQFIIASNQIATAVRNPHAAFWQIVGDETGGRAMSFVGYFVRWVQDGTTLRPTLCRLHVPQGGDDYRKLYGGSSIAWVDDALLESNAPAVAPSYQGWFADNVFSIWFRVLDSAGQPITKNAASVSFASGSFDSRQGFVGSGNNVIQGPALPGSVEVAVVVVDGSRLYGNTHAYVPAPGLGMDPNNFWDDIENSMTDPGIPKNIRDSLRVYSTRVPLRYAQ